MCLVAAVAASVAGCMGMPNSGPASEFSASPQSTAPDGDFIGPFPSGPLPGGSPSQIVQGFLVASASYPTYAAIAREYLLSSVSKAWSPGSVTVFSKLDVAGQALAQPVGRHGTQQAWVDVTGAVQATFNVSGEYVSAQSQGQPFGAYRFNLVKVNGQWRISNPPRYRMLSGADFSLYYKAQDLYFFDLLDQVLVPDSVFVPLGASASQLVSNLVNALTQDPKTPWLQNATETEVPQGTDVLNVSVDGATATVNLGGTAAHASTEVLQQVSAQLVWTLTGSPASPSAIQSVVLEIDGKAWTPPPSSCRAGLGPSPFQTQATYQCYNPYPSAPASFYYIDGNRLWSRCGSESQALRGSIGAVVPVVGRSGVLSSQRCGDGGYVAEVSTAPPPAQPRSLPVPSMAAVSPDGKYLAIVSPERNAVYTGALSGHAASFPATARLTGPGITALSWDRDDDLWVAQNGGIVMVPAVGAAVPVSFDGNGAVSDVSVAPDGVRIGLIVQNGLSRELELAAINRGAQPDAGQLRAPPVRISISSGAPLGPSIAHPVALTWYDADNLIVIDAASTGNTLWEVPVDGQQAQGPQPTPPGAISITANGAANALVAGLSSGRLAVSASLEGPWQQLGDPGLAPAYPG
jgi:hypothetical protein